MEQQKTEACKHAGYAYMHIKSLPKYLDVYLFSRILIPGHTFGGLLISLLEKLTQ
jgi:hypothetical protein